jgi:hypothetical protein
MSPALRKARKTSAAKMNEVKIREEAKGEASRAVKMSLQDLLTSQLNEAQDP